MMKVQKSKLIKIIRDRRQMKLRSNTHGCELTIAEKRNISNSIATTFIRTKISFSLLRSMLLCIRGSR